ncbi:sortase [Candidatus Shapirobacteria bacterium]|nr:sortase [Candidatus Shapirobacteria bacterium]
MSYLYVKETSPATPRTFRLRPVLKRHKRVFAGLLFVVGLFIFSSAILPIVQYQLEYSSKFGQIINPLSAHFYNNSGSVLGDLSTDYTRLNNWFVTDPGGNQVTSSIPKSGNTYVISIPNLKIKDAVVIIGSQDLKKSLIQYPQTALPGQLGNGVVFGHSVLPQFFNPKSYLTIFATLYRLKQGDEIDVTYDNIQYKYLVEEMFEVQPTDLSILEQRYDGKYISFVTCSPPGTYLRRLVVRARIADN